MQIKKVKQWIGVTPFTPSPGWRMNMAKKPKPTQAKATAKHGVSLPMIPWETHVRHNGKWVRTARPDLEAADVQIGTQCNADGDVVARRARVWRMALPPVIKALNPAGQAAMLDYGEALASVGAGGGGGGWGEGGGGCAGSRGPSIAKMIDAEALGRMNAALDKREMVIVRAANDPHGSGAHRASYRDVAAWVAVDGAGPREVLRRVGGPVTSGQAQARCTIAIAEVSQILAHCCGYLQSADVVWPIAQE